MYGDYAYRQSIIEMLKEQGERIDTDPEYRKQLIEEYGLDDLFSRMTEEHWRIADAKYGYKRDRT